MVQNSNWIMDLLKQATKQQDRRALCFIAIEDKMAKTVSTSGPSSVVGETATQRDGESWPPSGRRINFDRDQSRTVFYDRA
jgi:hypothetical protein